MTGLKKNWTKEKQDRFLDAGPVLMAVKRDFPAA